MPNSAVSFTLPELTDLFSAPDWQPGTHPPMPPVVANGRQPEVRAGMHHPDMIALAAYLGSRAS